MSIETTYDMQRSHAIERIIKIQALVHAKNYRAIEDASFESYDDVETFVEEWKQIDASNLNNWTNKMLENVVDLPFVRRSMFENYSVVDG